MKEKVRNIIKDNSQFEQVLGTAMESVGKERDQRTVNSMKAMSEDDFCAMISGMRGKDIHVELPDGDEEAKAIPLWRRTYVRLIAACIVALLAIGIVQKIDISTGSNQYASLFETYGSFNELTKKQLEEYKIGDNKRINKKGGRTTAAILEESAGLICNGNISDTRNGVQQLKELLVLKECKQSLKPEIHWYLGLGYLKLNMPTEAKYELEIVKNTQSPHASDAAEVLKKI